ncbi:PaaI family thioesterase [Pseudomonas sp. EA_35y_Pfl2_R111]|uniref:PaaI family thioesterase n=1 Tax=Pseudomonas sp. EA_35y_Pfl2_R111 TaxID=3088689 RepID=UPI0030DA1E72
MHATLFEQLQAWLAGDIGADYGISQLQAAAGVASFSSQPPAVHFNPLGGVHGGYTATLFDAALGLAVYSQASAEEVYVTASLQVNYLRPVGLAALPLHTEACVQQREGRQVSAQATLHDAQGQLCANASAVFTCLRHTASGSLPSVGAPAP